MIVPVSQHTGGKWCVAVALVALTMAVSGTHQASAMEPALRYPAAHRVNQTDDYHGTKVADPYRWLEDPSSPESRAWIEAENKLTFAWLEGIPQRARIRERLTELWNYERYGVPMHRGNEYLFGRNDGLQNQSVLYATQSLADPPRVLLDPNTLSAEGTVALTGTELSDDGRLLAYGLAAAGSDWQEWKVRDVVTGRDLDDHLKWIKFSGVSWTPDAKGFYYSRYDEPATDAALTGVNYYQKLYHHRLGTPQTEDALIYQRTDEKEWGFGGAVTEDGHYLAIRVRRGTDPRSQLFYKDLQQPDARVVELITGFDADYTFLGNDGPVFWLRTDLDAPRYRVIAVDTRNPGRDQWREVIPQAEETLDHVTVVGDRFFASYLKDAHSQVRVFDLVGKPLGDVALPGLGTANGFGGLRKDTETFYSFTSFTTPTTIYRYDIAAGASSVFRAPKVAFDSAQFEIKQVFYSSKDGTRVPMFIVHKQGLKLDGNNPTLLYAYGGFNISITPAFSVSRVAWLEMGGVLAVPNLRGGGEYGRAWHEAGMKLNKQNVFDDFIAAAEYLIEQKYTRSETLAIQGGSNGGLLVGACLTQRPGLFGAALPAVGVMDMLRFQKFTIGWAWVSEFGSSDNAREFAAIYRYSPLHNLQPGAKYPATFVTTADHDDRVVPAHSFKFAAELQRCQGDDRPTLIRIETSAGHGAGKPTTKLIDEAADIYAFLAKALGVTASP